MLGDTMPAGEFKARCLKLLDDVADSGQPLTITKHGRPVARLVPIPPATSVPPSSPPTKSCWPTALQDIWRCWRRGESLAAAPDSS